ncbi:DUF7344 domain-containing protein [Haloterrigena alkaliphila]|uniref:DUF7344 domain-containing protein n=1 Tax=Haloterrigena alkaliphila TaxID=2816475 RepID=A0A8A2VCL0_9EURY|nr:hypothetical protein [Haloterrigena alkaliphila]QSW99241.1 hypothetical protein J0X25_17980 [Haloterrigena alkaliphila]
MEPTDAFRVLASIDRQLVLHELVTDSEPVSIEQLSQRVASRRHGLPLERMTDEQLERAQVRLVHQHFPLLCDRNLLVVDWETREVALTGSPDVDSLFEAAEELEQWPPDDLIHDFAT